VRKRISAIGGSFRRHRLLFVLAVAILTIGIAGGVYAVSSSDSSAGQRLAGDHNWWSAAEIQNASFCGRCHAGVKSDVTAGVHKDASKSLCSFCHSPGSGGHAAKKASCVDCHTSEAGKVATDAHKGILTGLGESAATASKTCMSCHTHVGVNVTATGAGSITLTMP
jgi:hypothetical protein